MNMLRFLFGKPLPSPQGDAPSGANFFSYHHDSALKAILFAFLLAALLETIVIHFVAAYWSHLVAWLFTISSLWMALTVIAQIRAVGWRPIYIHDGMLHLRNGMYDLATIPLQDIADLKRTTEAPQPNRDSLKPLQACFPVGPNVIIRLEHPTDATLMYGIKREFDVALVCVDEPDRFVESIQSSHNEPQ